MTMSEQWHLKQYINLNTILTVTSQKVQCEKKSVHIPKKKIQNWSMHAKQNQLCSGMCPITHNLLTLLDQAASSLAHDAIKWNTGCHCKCVKPPSCAWDFRSNHTTE
jgi:hypothetical protein